MGIPALWQGLSQIGALEHLNRDQLHQLVKSIDGRTIAVDLSIWLFEAKKQPGLAGWHSDAGNCMLVVFERVCSWLRHGVLPIFVLEGLAPAAKHAELQQRYSAQNGSNAPQPTRGSHTWGGMQTEGSEVAGMLRAMGIPVVQAPGEAEAMCGALVAAGLADASASADTDILVFGSSVNYKQVHLQATRPENNTLELCNMQHVRRWFGINEGGADALLAVALLCGGDYGSGAGRVGHAKAIEAVRCLLSGRSDDSDVCARLRQAVVDGPDPKLLSLNQCTGCTRCGHEGGGKSKIKLHKRGCADCGTQEGECEPRMFDACGCEFHRRAPERRLAMVIECASKDPDFLPALDAVEAAYRAGRRMADATAAALKQQGWRAVWSRPSLSAVAACMGKSYTLNWRLDTIRSKLRPLLVEWDLQHPDAAVEWRPLAIQKVSTNLSTSWRYIIQLERITGVSHSEDEASDLAWLHGEQLSTTQGPSQAAGGGEDHSQMDGASAVASQSESTQKAKPKGGADAVSRSFRISMLKQAWPDLVQTFERVQQAKADAATAKAARRAKDAKASEVTTAQQQLMARTFKVVKNLPHQQEQLSSCSGGGAGGNGGNQAAEAGASTSEVFCVGGETQGKGAEQPHSAPNKGSAGGGTKGPRNKGKQQQQQEQQQEGRRPVTGPLDRFLAPPHQGLHTGQQAKPSAGELPCFELRPPSSTAAPAAASAEPPPTSTAAAALPPPATTAQTAAPAATRVRGAALAPAQPPVPTNVQSVHDAAGAERPTLLERLQSRRLVHEQALVRKLQQEQQQEQPPQQHEKPQQQQQQQEQPRQQEHGLDDEPNPIPASPAHTQGPHRSLQHPASPLSPCKRMPPTALHSPSKRVPQTQSSGQACSAGGSSVQEPVAARCLFASSGEVSSGQTQQQEPQEGRVVGSKRQTKPHVEREVIVISDSE